MFLEVRFTTWLNYENYVSGYVYLNALTEMIVIDYKLSVLGINLR